MLRQQYTRRLPKSLAQSLPIHHEHLAGPALHRINIALRASIKGRDEMLLVEIRRFCHDLNMEALLTVTKQYCPGPEFADIVLMAACEAGDTSLARPYRHRVVHNTNFLRCATRYMHWDVLDVLLSGWSLSYAPAEYCAISLMSMSSLRYYMAKYKGLPYVSSNLRLSAVANCYLYGFDAELLDFVYQAVPREPPLQDDAIIEASVPLIGAVHISAPETLEYVIKKYPSVDWSEVTIYEIMDGGEFPPGICEKLIEILKRAGVSLV